MDIVELVKEKLGSVIFGDVSITVGGDIVNVYCRHCVGDVEYGDKTYRKWDVSMIQLRLSQGLLDGRMMYELDIVDDKTVYRDVETRNDVLGVMDDLASDVGVHSIVDISSHN